MINPFVKIIPVKFKILDQKKRYEVQPLNILITKHNVFISLFQPDQSTVRDHSSRVCS